MKVEYNDRSSNVGSDNETEDDTTDFTFDIMNETNIENIDDYTRIIMYMVCKLYSKMNDYINQVPVIGYNSSKYDLLVIRSKLIPKIRSSYT